MGPLVGLIERMMIVLRTYGWGSRESQISAGEKWTFSDAFLDGADVIWRIR